MSKVRDTQRQRLYDAERAATLTPSDTARRLMIDAPRVPSTGAVTVEACQQYIDHLCQSAWFQRRWGLRKFTARHKAYGSATHTSGWGGGIVSLPPWARDEWVLLHEVAHGLTGYSDCAAHGPEFAGVFLTLVEHRMGKSAGASLREAFKAKRVRYNLRRVPAPDNNRVREYAAAKRVRVPSAQVAARHAEAHAARTARKGARKAATIRGYNFGYIGQPAGEFAWWFGSADALLRHIAVNEGMPMSSLSGEPRPMSRVGQSVTYGDRRAMVTWATEQVGDDRVRVTLTDEQAETVIASEVVTIRR